MPPQQIVPAFLDSPWQLLVILVVALLLFGRRLPDIMRGLGSSVKEFKKGMTTEEQQGATPPAAPPAQQPPPYQPPAGSVGRDQLPPPPPPAGGANH